MNIHSGSVFITPRMCTYTNAASDALHMCMCIHTGAVFTAPHMCTYTGACDDSHMCVYIYNSSLRCIANVYEYTLRIGFHRSTHVYIVHKRSLRCNAHAYVYTQRTCPVVFTAPLMCTYIGPCDAPHMCTYIHKSSLRCVANVSEYTLRIGFHRSTSGFHRSTHVYMVGES